MFISSYKTSLHFYRYTFSSLNPCLVVVIIFYTVSCYYYFLPAFHLFLCRGISQSTTLAKSLNIPVIFYKDIYKYVQIDIISILIIIAVSYHFISFLHFLHASIPIDNLELNKRESATKKIMITTLLSLSHFYNFKLLNKRERKAVRKKCRKRTRNFFFQGPLSSF